MTEVLSDFIACKERDTSERGTKWNERRDVVV